jgi:hypothetical protein
MRLRAAYRPRPIRCQGVVELGGWRIKVYGIAYGGAAPRDSLVEAAKRQAAQMLPQPAITDSRYGVGFLGAHQGLTADVVFINWWEVEDELHHHMFVADPESDTESETGLRPAQPHELTACIWDLAVLGFERDAWVESVLKRADGPDLDGYLSAQLNADV